MGVRIKCTVVAMLLYAAFSYVPGAPWKVSYRSSTTKPPFDVISRRMIFPSQFSKWPLRLSIRIGVMGLSQTLRRGRSQHTGETLPALLGSREILVEDFGESNSENVSTVTERHIPTSAIGESAIEYNVAAVERKWQAYWDANETFHSPNVTDVTKEKCYVLDMFPYPSGEGLHVGHCKGYTATDVYARMKRMQGYNVLHPIGWDAFGLPAEQYALQTYTPPDVSTKRNIIRFKKQLKRMGFSYDWKRELCTASPNYYKWTQWIFLQLFHRNLAYQAIRPVWWCPALGTVLANEEVIDGKSERGGHAVYVRPMKQWVLKISAFANRLLEDLQLLKGWPENVKEMQRHWIGKTDGIEVKFKLIEIKALGAHRLNYSSGCMSENAIPADMHIWGFAKDLTQLRNCSYIAVSPEWYYGILENNTFSFTREKEIESFLKMVYRKRSEYLSPKIAMKEEVASNLVTSGMNGCFTGLYAIHPLEHTYIPVVLAEYMLDGTGELSSIGNEHYVERDRQFVFENKVLFASMRFGNHSYEEKSSTGLLCRFHNATGSNTDMLSKRSTESNCHRAPLSTPFRTLSTKLSEEFPEVSSKENNRPNYLYDNATAEYLKKHQLLRSQSAYKMRDWIFSRQRLWGEPFPIAYHESNGSAVALEASELPVTLPNFNEDTFKAYGSDGIAPLSQFSSWVNTTIQSGHAVCRETLTMPQWAGSNWYYLRFIDPHNNMSLCNRTLSDYWAPVDVYAGGAEHATLHLLYARFMHKFLYDLGVVKTVEPFMKLMTPGMILGPNTAHFVLSMASDGSFVNATDTVFYKRDNKALRSVLLQPATPTKNITPIVVGYHQTKLQPIVAKPLSQALCNESYQLFKKDDRWYARILPSHRKAPFHSKSQQPDTNATIIELLSLWEKMSKSRGNTVSPESIVEKWGADALRLHMLFLGPMESVHIWSLKGLSGVSRFLHRIARLFKASKSRGMVCSSNSSSPSLSASEDARFKSTTGKQPPIHPTAVQLEKMNTLIKKVTEGIQTYSFNVAIAAMMAFLNDMYKWSDGVPTCIAEIYIKLLHPFCPHLAEELWENHWKGILTQSIRTATVPSLSYSDWPKPDSQTSTDKHYPHTLKIYINGKLRGTLCLDPKQSANAEMVIQKARSIETVQKALAYLLRKGRVVKKTRYIPHKAISFIVN